MFHFVKNIFKDSRGAELRMLLVGSLSKLVELKSANDISQNMCLLSMAEAYTLMVNEHKHFPNISEEDACKIGHQLVKDGNKLQATEGSRSLGLMFLGLYVVSRTLPGEDALYVYQTTSSFLKEGLEVCRKSNEIELFFKSSIASNCIDVSKNYIEEPVAKESDSFDFLGHGDSDGIDSDIKQKIHSSIDQLFDLVLSDSLRLIGIIKPNLDGKVTVERKKFMYKIIYLEFTSLYIGQFYFYLTATVNKSIFSTQLIDDMFNYFASAIIDKHYTKKGLTADKNSYVHYAIKHYKYAATTTDSVVNCVDHFKSNLSMILAEQYQVENIKTAVNNAATNSTTDIWKFYQRIYRS